MVSQEAESPRDRALRHVASLSSGPPLDTRLRITINFHPDRQFRGRLLLAALVDDAVYHSQFVTGTSNGGLTAYPGGDRWTWEHRLFAGAYDDLPAHTRPIYGALNFRHRAVGAAPRFGSAHLRLTADAMERASFCYPDSVFEPTAFGVASRMSLISLAEVDERDLLDDYIEAHIHGGVRLDRDVEALVLDPSYRTSDVATAAERLSCPVEWHPGFQLTVDELRRHPSYRGQGYVELGTEIAVNGILNPRILGDAASTGNYDEPDLKRVWHYVARFGVQPIEAPVRKSPPHRSSPDL